MQCIMHHIFLFVVDDKGYDDILVPMVIVMQFYDYQAVIKFMWIQVMMTNVIVEAQFMSAAIYGDAGYYDPICNRDAAGHCDPGYCDQIKIYIRDAVRCTSSASSLQSCLCL